MVAVIFASSRIVSPGVNFCLILVCFRRNPNKRRRSKSSYVCRGCPFQPELGENFKHGHFFLISSITCTVPPIAHLYLSSLVLSHTFWVGRYTFEVASGQRLRTAHSRKRSRMFAQSFEESSKKASTCTKRGVRY